VGSIRIGRQKTFDREHRPTIYLTLLAYLRMTSARIATPTSVPAGGLTQPARPPTVPKRAVAKD